MPFRVARVAVLALSTVLVITSGPLAAVGLAAPTITYVQGNYLDPQTPQTTVTVTFTAAQASGDLIVVVVGWNDSTAAVVSVADSSNNPYLRAVGPTSISGVESQSIYYAANIKAAAAGANRVTVTFSGAAQFPDIRILEYRGADLTNPVDVAGAASGNSVSSDSGSVTTTSASDLIFGASVVQTTSTGPGSGFTTRLLTQPDADIAEDRMVTARGSYSATAPVSPSGEWIMQMVAFRAASGDSTPPTAPSALGTSVNGTQITLSWTASTDNVGVTGYLLERCQGASCSTFTQIATPTATTYSDLGLAPGSYSYRVRATDAAGNLSTYSNVASGTVTDTTAPTAPSALGVTVVGSQVNLSWTASTDNVGVTGYLLERCQGASCSTFTQIATPTATTYSDGGLAIDSYSYRVRATDAAGNLSAYSNVASGTVRASLESAAYAFNEGTGTTTADASSNAITGILHNTAWTTAGKYGNALSFNGSSSYVDLGRPSALSQTGSMTWEAWIFATGTPGDDGQIIALSNDTTGWQLKTSPDTGPRTFAVALSADTTSHTQRYSRTVIALNTWYHVAGVYNAAVQSLDIFVNGVLDDGTLRNVTSSRTGIPAAQVLPNGVNANIGRRAGANGFYFIGTIDDVRVYNRALSQAEIQTDMNTPVGAPADTQPPTPPASLTATAASGTENDLGWTASTDNVAVTRYLVERCQGAGCVGFTQIGTPTGTTLNDTGLTPNTSYKIGRAHV